MNDEQLTDEQVYTLWRQYSEEQRERNTRLYGDQYARLPAQVTEDTVAGFRHWLAARTAMLAEYRRQEHEAWVQSIESRRRRDHAG